MHSMSVFCRPQSSFPIDCKRKTKVLHMEQWIFLLQPKAGSKSLPTPAGLHQSTWSKEIQNAFVLFVLIGKKEFLCYQCELKVIFLRAGLICWQEIKAGAFRCLSFQLVLQLSQLLIGPVEVLRFVFFFFVALWVCCFPARPVHKQLLDSSALKPRVALQLPQNPPSFLIRI